MEFVCGIVLAAVNRRERGKKVDWLAGPVRLIRICLKSPRQTTCTAVSAMVTVGFRLVGQHTALGCVVGRGGARGPCYLCLRENGNGDEYVTRTFWLLDMVSWCSGGWRRREGVVHCF